MARLSPLLTARSGGAADTGGTVRGHQGAAGTQDNTARAAARRGHTLPALFFDVHVTFFTLKNKSLAVAKCKCLIKI